MKGLYQNEPTLESPQKVSSFSGRGTGNLLAVGDLRLARALLHVPTLLRHQEADGEVGHGENQYINKDL